MQYAAFPSSGMSNSLFSKMPLNGMMGSPPCAFTHSKICPAHSPRLMHACAPTWEHAPPSAIMATSDVQRCPREQVWG